MKYQYILFDFGGVLVESNEIRFNGFRKLFMGNPADATEPEATVTSFPMLTPCSIVELGPIKVLLPT